MKLYHTELTGVFYSIFPIVINSDATTKNKIGQVNEQ